MQLWIGNKNYSSWSMRPWVLMRQLGLPFEERLVRFDDMGPDSAFRQQVRAVSAAQRVPVLVDEGRSVWDSLAIAEYLAEKYPGQALWPRDRHHRALARSMCAEMHAGFSALRNHCPMNIEADQSEVGLRIQAEQPAVVADLARITQMWSSALADSGGPMLLGEFGIVDAYYAPVACRIKGFGLKVPAEAAAYVDRLLATTAVQAWVQDALVEKTFVAFDEPYRSART